MKLPPLEPAIGHAAIEPFLDTRHGEHLVRLLEGFVDVQRRHQFFNWASTHVHALAPHRVLVCGHFQRQRRALHFDCFHSVPLEPDMVARLSLAGGELLGVACAAWIEGMGRPLALELKRFANTAAHDEAEQLRRQSGCPLLLVHGCARPQRPDEIESLFAFACLDSGGVARHLLHLGMILPTMHAAWQRVQSQPSEGRTPAPGKESRRPAPPAVPRIVTGREQEILDGMGAGLSNQRIAERLGISPLTVKNHVQKLLRKLGASNRAQAVALAMTHNLLTREPGGNGPA